MAKKYKNKKNNSATPTRKTNINPYIINDVQEISENEVYDVLNFAQQIYGGTFMNNIMSPELTNSRLKDATLNPLAGTQANIEKALMNPKNSEKELVGFSEFFELTSMIYKRSLMYLGNILSFSVKDMVCINAEQEDYRSATYKNDYKEVCNFLDKFKIKEEFPKVIRQLIRQDVFFCILRDDGDKYTLQELPKNYCMLTGRFNYGWLFDFNMSWFLQNGVNIEMYPSIFKEMFLNTFGDEIYNYNSASTLDDRSGAFSYWSQTSPVDGFWAWKMNPESATRVPYFAPLFQDIVLQPMVRQLQSNKYIIEATKVMVGLIPMLNEAKAGNVKDMIAISSETAGKFLSLLRRGISDVIKTGAVPFSDVKVLDFEDNKRNMMEDFNKNTASQTGINSRLVFPIDKQNSLETQYSVEIDSMTITYMYGYFENFLNYQINKRTSKYKFNITLDGTKFSHNMKNRRDEVGYWADKGVVLPNRIAYSLDILPHHLYKQLEEAKESGFTDLLMPLINIFTTSAEDLKSNEDDKNKTNMVQKENKPKGKRGRPAKELNELSDSGLQTRQDASNVGKSKT